MGFAVRFLVLFALLTGAFEASRGTAFERAVVEGGILAPTTRLINTLTPGEDVRLRGRMLARPDGGGLRVTRGCEGIEMFLLLGAAIVAYPAAAGRKLRGLAWGFALAYVLSIARLLTLHYVLRYSPGAWEALHGLVLPLGPIALLVLYFLWWSGAPPPRTAPE